MSYKNGKEVLPPHLLKELQKYIQGELIYIPKQTNQRAGWGEANGSRLALAERNEEIYRLYREGYSFEELEQTYNLSMDSIRKIVYKTRENNSEMK
ncbi:CD3324 family protein [Oceanobacillus jeddahense]|uniref:CD3324 family protein n=1 Tax=Oceanobacillus jeddahense TaxID=1462527 RepID=A0ABY5JRI3_9BACI|nr:CD3324 family protein [Oceanobacillus jeddahense]UUI01224.1 CD3324 family protein [Oceanobacillus jeddahense]